MSRIGMRGKKVNNVLVENEAKPTNSASTNGKSGLKRGRPKKKDIENTVSIPADVNEKNDPEDLPPIQKTQAKEKKIKSIEVENSANTNSIVKNGAMSSEEPNPKVPSIKKMGRSRKNCTEVDLKVVEINGKNVPEDSPIPAEENKVNVNVVPDLLDAAPVQNVRKRKNVAIEESRDSLENKTSVSSSIDLKEKNKDLAPTKLGRKKKVDAKTAIEDLKVDAPVSEYKAEEKPPVKRGRKNLKSKKVAESDCTETMIVATNPNVPEVTSEANITDKTTSKVAGKRGRKKLETIEKVEHSKRIRVKTNENITSNEKDDNVSDLLLARSNTAIDKEDELSDIEAKAKEPFQKSPVKTKGTGAVKKSPAIDTKSCIVMLDRDEVAESAAQEIFSKLSRKKSDESKTKKTAKNGESSKGKNKRGKDTNEDNSKPSKVPKKATKSSETKNIAKTPEMEALDFSNKSTNLNGKPWNIKISSWNINGVRAWLEKDGISYLHHENPDIITLQETKCSDDKFPDKIGKIDNYHSYWVSGDKEGYSGVCLLSKQKPIEVKYGIGIDLHDTEGRVITAEYEKFFVVAAYVPNAGRGLIRLEYRTQWDQDFRSYLKELDSKKPIVLCGDLNVAHEEIDLANPKTNKKNAGFTKEEREGFSKLLEDGFIDTFRHLYPDAKGAYTFWTYMMNARLKNVGWRLDYFVISKRLADSLCDNIIRKDVYGSDHCPITLFLAF